MPNKRLVVIGSGEEYEAIKKIANDNIEVLGYQEDTVLLEYMQKARAFVYAAVEDFGIVPVEAMACGTPVVALGFGGTKESVSEGISGVHFFKQTKESIITAIHKFESMKFNPRTISEYAKKFSSREFKLQFNNFVLSKTKVL
jgi:glycosyltransferase involved in cell wall biosynthesis